MEGDATYFARRANKESCRRTKSGSPDGSPLSTWNWPAVMTNWRALLLHAWQCPQPHEY